MPFAMTYGDNGVTVRVLDDSGEPLALWMRPRGQAVDDALASRGWTRIGEWFPNDEGSAALVMRERE